MNTQIQVDRTFPELSTKLIDVPNVSNVPRTAVQVCEFSTSKLQSLSACKCIWNPTKAEECDIGKKRFPPVGGMSSVVFSRWYRVSNLGQLILSLQSSDRFAREIQSLQGDVSSESIWSKTEKCVTSRNIWWWGGHCQCQPCLDLVERDRARITLMAAFPLVLQHDSEGWSKVRRAGMEQMVRQSDLAKLLRLSHVVVCLATWLSCRVFRCFSRRRKIIRFHLKPLSHRTAATQK